LEINGQWRTVGQDRLPIRCDAVHHKFHRNFSSITDAGLLKMPAPETNLHFLSAYALGFWGDFGFEPCSDETFDLDRPRSRKIYIRITAGVAIHREF
jgi:hypothetical protein